MGTVCHTVVAKRQFCKSYPLQTIRFHFIGIVASRRQAYFFLDSASQFSTTDIGWISLFRT
jgi:hypothetical protein